ncbi:hypothetical protein GobsT_48150 [Gemmata obscuriglobus]|uniref:DUF7691 domain-containing protein n=1 Tax=Gemmata obscuriglobus TaxID=114 RepID=A0A2Z3GX63_9BACT|nr:hypothetical protein [Gemmata obscuriglobus]AWM37241.1 hypothetical protein C1280_09530 [Gemmata obscuriglobus]QEG30015.1 hypothetical protein GobsT_48150 [Gemmata obscuriglobus]VTS09336.1 Uncharacterized protein OS=Nocardia brasiliensis ATCC 700358 GN=O3I_027985 PE=4 SV=1 [Gemmata obscuriglobus UQM 2246]
MSQGLTAYLVPRDEVLAAPGSGDRELVTDILESFAEDIEQLDSDFETGDPDCWEGPTAAGAVAELIGSRPSMDEDDAGLYATAFELVCRYYGAWASNNYFSPCRVEWFNRLDGILTAGGVPLSLVNLWCIAPPLRPPWDRLLEFGHWSAGAMLAASAPLGRLLPTVADAEERAALVTVAGWLRAAEAAPGSILVGFFR